MRSTILWIFAFFSFSLLGHAQIIEKFKVVEKGENIHRLDFGRNKELFFLNLKGQVKKMNTDSSATIHTFKVKAKSMAVANTSDQLAIGDAEGNVTLFEGSKQTRKFKAHNKQVYLLVFGPGDKLMVSLGADSKIKVWSAKSYDFQFEINTQADPVTDIQFSLDENSLVYSTETGKVMVWNLKDRKISAVYKVSNTRIRSVAVSPDSMVFAAGGDDRKITVFSFRKSDYYQLPEVHKNIITRIRFFNKNYILSVGHDHHITMTNINIPTGKEELGWFKDYPKYRTYLYELAGDKYFSDLSISEDSKMVAIGSYGKGITFTDYFHELIERPHRIIIKEVDHVEIDTNKVASEFKTEFFTKRRPLIIKGRITRHADIRNVWLYYVNDNKRIKLNIDDKGAFNQQVGMFSDLYDYAIIVEDWDKNLRTVRYEFRLHFSD